MEKGFVAVVPAAGRGERSGRSRPKQFEELLGEPVLRRSIRPLIESPDCRGLILAIDPDYRTEVEAAVAGFDRITIVSGGERRQDSVLAALDHVPTGVPIVLVHDAARPCLQSWLVDRIYQTALRYDAAIPGLPVLDTLKQINAEGRIVRTVPREEYRLAQTPQGFTVTMLRDAYRTAAEQGWSVTDEAGLLERAGEEVVVVDGDPENIKVTIPEDFRRAEDILRRRPVNFK